MKINSVVRGFVLASVLLVAIVVGGHLWAVNNVSGADLHQRLYAFHLFSLGASVMLLLAVMWYVMRSIASPLSGLTSFLEDIDEGYVDMKSPTKISEADNELGDLARALDNTLSRLAETKLSKAKLAETGVKKKAKK